MGFDDPSHGYPGWSLDEETSRPLIRHALEAGINFFDTANMYSNGQRGDPGQGARGFTNRDEWSSPPSCATPGGLAPTAGSPVRRS